jgi:preprotein translocase subunit YajC
MLANFRILAAADGNDSGMEVQSVPMDAEDMETQQVIETSGDPNQTVTQQQDRPGGHFQIILLVLMFVALYFIMFRGPRKKQQEHSKMVQALSKNDRVRTIGGIIGTVIDIKDDEVVLKVDENTNAKIRVAKAAISKVLGDDVK